MPTTFHDNVIPNISLTGLTAALAGAGARSGEPCTGRTACRHSDSANELPSSEPIEELRNVADRGRRRYDGDEEVRE
jgi:hypothetical protein